MPTERQEATTSGPPAEGEKTKAQNPRVSGGGGVAGLLSLVEGYGRPPAGTYQTYRDMRCDPTIAMARAIATAPCRLANWSFEERKDAPKNARDWIADHMDGFHDWLMLHIMYALDYGWQPFEKIIGVIDSDSGPRLGYRKLKPLLPDMTEIKYQADTGIFDGLKQGDITLAPNKCFVFTNDPEGTDLYGRSRMENLRRKVWPAADKLYEREGQYVQKAAGIIPMIQYPEGESEDGTGSTVGNFQLAQAILAHLGKGHGVAMPNTMAKWVEELANKGISNPEALKAWIITFLEAGGQHGAEFVALGQRYDQLKFRGWLVPERAAMEGTHGTKAEAESHADVGLMVAELLLEDIARHINWYLIDPLLVWNWGESARGQVWLVPEKLVNEQKELLRTVMTAMLSTNVDVLNDLLDMDAVVDVLGLPKSSEATTLIEGHGTEEEEAAMLDRLAGMGNDVTIDDTRAVVAASRWLHGLRRGGNGRGR